jgi:murein DD-endopeptidase MepM/ murein hydrolase activator NlpD
VRLSSRVDLHGRILKHQVKIFARVLIVALMMLVVAAVARPFAERVWFVYNLAIQEPAMALPEPLASRQSLRFVDSWGNPRPGGRSHQGIDIFAAKDTPVLSTTNGMVTRVGTNNLGGQVIWILGPGLERHYYAHLNRPGVFRAGDRVNAGEIIGYAGNTGNARGGAVHLHYGIYRNGAAQNPYPRFAAGARDAVSRTARPRATTS